MKTHTQVRSTFIIPVEQRGHEPYFATLEELEENTLIDLTYQEQQDKVRQKLVDECNWRIYEHL